MILHDLDKPCLACQRPAGDHTLREWNACMGATTTDAQRQRSRQRSERTMTCPTCQGTHTVYEHHHGGGIPDEPLGCPDCD